MDVQYKSGLRLILARLCMTTVYQFLIVVFRLLKEIYDPGYNTKTKLMTEPLLTFITVFYPLLFPV